MAWWPINAANAAALPPPAELRDLSLAALVGILTSAKPLHQALSGWLRRNEAATTPESNGVELDPHKRVDTSTFLLQRTNRVSWALSGLRTRLERPVLSAEALAWRLRGPVGVEALARAILREAHSEQERCFLLAELALELGHAKPASSPGCLSPEKVRDELKKMVTELRDKIDAAAMAGFTTLADYANAAFEEALR